jgi:hypothetical protein
MRSNTQILATTLQFDHVMTILYWILGLTIAGLVGILIVRWARSKRSATAPTTTPPGTPKKAPIGDKLDRAIRTLWQILILVLAVIGAFLLYWYLFADQSEKTIPKSIFGTGTNEPVVHSSPRPTWKLVIHDTIALDSDWSKSYEVYLSDSIQIEPTDTATSLVWFHDANTDAIDSVVCKKNIPLSISPYTDKLKYRALNATATTKMVTQIWRK